VWRSRKQDLHLERRQSWYVSTAPEFSREAADVVGPYLNPPENVLVLCEDEKPLHSNSGACARLDPLTQRSGTESLCTRVQTRCEPRHSLLP